MENIREYDPDYLDAFARRLPTLVIDLAKREAESTGKTGSRPYYRECARNWLHRKAVTFGERFGLDLDQDKIDAWLAALPPE